MRIFLTDLSRSRHRNASMYNVCSKNNAKTKPRNEIFMSKYKLPQKKDIKLHLHLKKDKYC